jgi:chromosome segregation ATPase
VTDKLNQNEEADDSQADNRDIAEVKNPEQSTESTDRITELENLVVEKEERLVKTNERIAELEQAIADKDGEINALKGKEAELGEKLTTTENFLADAVSSYRGIVIKTNQNVPEELIGGNNIEAVDESLEKAKVLVDKVRQGLENEVSLSRIPSGAPERTSPDLSGFSPREKIQQAMNTKR